MFRSNSVQRRVSQQVSFNFSPTSHQNIKRNNSSYFSSVSELEQEFKKKKEEVIFLSNNVEASGQILTEYIKKYVDTARLGISSTSARVQQKEPEQNKNISDLLDDLQFFENDFTKRRQEMMDSLNCDKSGVGKLKK